LKVYQIVHFLQKLAWTQYGLKITRITKSTTIILFFIIILYTLNIGVTVKYIILFIIIILLLYIYIILLYIIYYISIIVINNVPIIIKKRKKGETCELFHGRIIDSTKPDDNHN
jgi:hypothetical protein